MNTHTQHYLFTKTHEWINKDNQSMKVGITNHAQNLLGDIVFIELPTVGTVVKAGQEIGVLESVKAASDYYAPITGTITAINTKVQDCPELINQDPYGQGWICQITPEHAPETNHLITEADYLKLINEA